MSRLFAVVAIAALFAIAATAAFAASNPSTTGQPSQTCLTAGATSEPGNSANASGSAFNENGGTAGAVYAGNGANTNTPASQQAVAQYDVACYQVTQNH